MSEFRVIPATKNPDPLVAECGCSPPHGPDIWISRASGREGEIRVCSHGNVWELYWKGIGHMHLDWRRVWGWRAWRARRKVRPKELCGPGYAPLQPLSGERVPPPVNPAPTSEPPDPMYYRRPKEPPKD